MTLFLGGDVALERVGDQHPRDLLEALASLAKEPLSGFGRASALDETEVAFLIDRPPERMMLAIRRDDPFIQVPLIAPPGLPMARFVREALTELESPWADRLVGGVSGAMDTAGEFDDEESYAAVAIGAREAKADRRVLAQGRSVSQASTRATFMAMTVNTC